MSLRPPSLDGVAHRTVPIRSADGPLAVHVAEVAGSGPPLLLLHGWPQHWWTWRRVVPLLTGEFRLLMPDLRGFGWTAAPGRGYDPLTFAADAVALLDALGIERAGVVGHDWGGFTAYLLALRHPGRIAGAVACNTPYPWARVDARDLWRGWYAAVLASPAGARLVASRRFGDALAGVGERAAGLRRRGRRALRRPPARAGSRAGHAAAVPELPALGRRPAPAQRPGRRAAPHAARPGGVRHR